MSRDAFVRGKTQVPVRPASYLKKTFSLSQTGKATLYVAAHGIVCCYLNGVRLSDPLCPGPAEYDRRLPYAEYDASSALRIGENELLIVLVSGWWRGKMTNDGLINIYGNDVALLCVLQTEEGAVVSDESWLASQEGPVRFSDLMDGELCDARLEPSGWHAVTTYPFGYAALVPMSPAPIREKQRLKGKFIRTPKGALLLDLGQNIAGYLELDFTGEAGKRLVMTHGETLGSDGELTLENFQSPNNHVKQRVEYICREGHNHFVPSGSYFGFRYVGLEADFPLSEEMFTAVAPFPLRRTFGRSTLFKRRPKLAFQRGGGADGLPDPPEGRFHGRSAGLPAYGDVFERLQGLCRKLAERPCRNAVR